MTTIAPEDWPRGYVFRTEEDGSVLVTILQEFFPEREFPLLFRSFEYEYEVKISRQWGNVENRFMKSTLTLP